VSARIFPASHLARSDSLMRAWSSRVGRPIPGLELPKTDIPLHNLSLGPHDRLGQKRLERERLRRAEQQGDEVETKDVKGKGKERMSLEDVVKRGAEVDDTGYEKQLSRKEKLAVSAKTCGHYVASVGSCLHPYSILLCPSATAPKDRLASLVLIADHPFGPLASDETRLPGHAPEGFFGPQEVHEG